MLARRSILRHPSGVSVETPLLIPSFSSKGFQFNKEGASEVTEALRITSEVITESVLVSAYDIYHKHIPAPNKFMSVPEVIFVDSGGYETADDHDMSAVFKHSCEVKEWNKDLFRSVLDKFPSHIPAVFVSYDHGTQKSSTKPLRVQIDEARELFRSYPEHLHSMIIKPEKRGELTFKGTLTSILNNIEKFSHFHIVGVTEKELGNSLLLKMENIAKIRLALDKAGIHIPLQIFGSLDPLSSCLYFIAGAEIFDGLTWLRYSYLDGIAIYSQNYGALTVGIHAKNKILQATTLVNNIHYLQNLQYRMGDFLLEEDFNKFKYNTAFLEESYDTLRSKLKGEI